MIRRATKDDTQTIKDIWSVCFPEDPADNDYFFENEYYYANSLLYIEDDKAVATLQRIPYTLSGEVPVKLSYIYGAATLPDYRKRGIMKELLLKSFELDKDNGVGGSVLIPANKNLFNYYEDIGYKTIFYVDKDQYNFVDNCIDIHEATKADIPQMLLLYNAMDMPHIERKPAYFRNQIDMFNKLNCKVFVCENGYAFVSETDELTIQELVTDSIDTERKLCCSIMKAMDKNKVYLTKPGTNRPFGMVKWHDDNSNKKSYMNLMFN